MPSRLGTTGEQGSIRTRPARVPARAAARLLDTRSTRGDVMKIGDLVKYHPKECNNQIPGLVLGFENIEASVDYLLVQWLDWTPGEIAVECASGLVVVSSANENR